MASIIVVIKINTIDCFDEGFGEDLVEGVDETAEERLEALFDAGGLSSECVFWLMVLAQYY